MLLRKILGISWKFLGFFLARAHNAHYSNVYRSIKLFTPQNASKQIQYKSYWTMVYAYIDVAPLRPVSHSSDSRSWSIIAYPPPSPPRSSPLVQSTTGLLPLLLSPEPENAAHKKKPISGKYCRIIFHNFHGPQKQLDYIQIN